MLKLVDFSKCKVKKKRKSFMVVTAVICAHDQLHALQTNASLRQTFLRFAFQCFFRTFCPINGPVL